jgi:hypothetical protein
MALIILAFLVLAALLAALAQRWVVFTVLIMFALLPIAILVARWATWVDMKQEVKSTPPRLFPVLIVGKTADGRRERLVTYFENLEKAKARYATWSFLLAEEDPSDDRAIGFDRDIFGPAYSMERLENGRQRFEVHGAPDDDVMNRSWYVAANQQIFPEAYEHYGRADQTAACGAIALVIVIWIPLAIVIPLYVRSRVGGTKPQNSQA